MTKGERLIWELFEMVKELMSPTAQNAERFNLWAAKFHEMEAGNPQLAQPPSAAPEPVEAVAAAEDELDAAEDELDAGPAADPHEHGVPSRPPKRKRK